jgi:hypothetical protein
MSERRSRSRSTRNLQLKILDGGDTPHVNKEWGDWFKHRIGSYKNSLTITEHKKNFFNARPDWAKTFSERHIDENLGTRQTFSFNFKKSTRKWRLEREIVENNDGSEFVVERINDAAGNCRQVTILFPMGERVFKFRKEKWVSRGKWKIAQEFVFEKNSGFYTDSDFFKSTKPWLPVP